MAIIDVKKRTVRAKIVYYGPGRSGKTANLQYLHEHLKDETTGRLVSLATKTKIPQCIDVMPVRLGEIEGFETTYTLCTVAGQALYNNTKKLVLKETDGVVFVADSQLRKREANLDAFLNLQENLEEHGVKLKNVSHVIQYNKRDLEQILNVSEMRRVLNPFGVPDFEASAVQGKGIVESLRAVSELVARDLKQRL